MSADKQPTLKRRWRRFTRRHAYIAAALVGGVALAVILLVLFLFRLGYVDRYRRRPDKTVVCKLRNTRGDSRLSRHVPASDRGDGRS